MALPAQTADRAFDLEAAMAENAAVRVRLLATLAGVPAERRLETAIDEWSVADVAAHLAGAQEGYAEALEHVARGEPARITGWEPGPPHDWNRATVAERRGRDWARLLADLDLARARHEAAARSVPLDVYAASHDMGPWTAFANEAQHFAANVARHEGAHARELEAWSRALHPGARA